MLKILTGLLVILCCSYLVLGDYCLSTPQSLPIGTSCSDNKLACRKGSFCSSKGVCQELIKAGSACNERYDVCEADALCLGPVGGKVCVLNAILGAPCSTNSSDIAPFCSPRYRCERKSQDNKYYCRGGRVGDQCTEKDDCIGFGDCVNKICSGLGAGNSCFSTSVCEPKSVCYQGKCITAPTSGNCSECAFGYICAKQTKDAPAQCILLESKLKGEYCQQNLECKDSARCLEALDGESYCAQSSSQFCEGTSECGGKETCSCNGSPLQRGIGECKTVSCWGQTVDLAKCLFEKCHYDNSFTTAEPGSCTRLNCFDAWKRYDSCNSASLSSISFVLVAFFALLTQLF